MNPTSKPVATHKAAKRWYIFVFLAPATLIYTVFAIYPIIESLRLSLYVSADGADKFIGLANYTKLLGEPYWAEQFWNAFKNNVLLFLLHMLIQNPIALTLAALLSIPTLKGAAIYRTVFFLPTLLSVVVVGFIWQLMLSPTWGVTSSAMQALGIGHWFQPWLGLESSALLTVTLISIWQYVGIPLMLFYAALLNIPEETIEAARIDGLNGWWIFWKVKLPLILPTLGLVGILTYIGNFTASFDIIYTLQGGLAGPNFSTDVMGTFLFRSFFGFQAQLGDEHMGATVASALFFIILIGVGFYLFGVQRKLQRYDS
ncbi:carbohydrate ABC transporter permease [Granulosicoccus antarcticus]|uniref:Lactose transport system permease protein LacF n=1 Tax=Granulosicoccus antarcticus IMCC3135 TaxID=1192854 RepID=A0A2Z2NGH3_9GAMM|nr:sugar ABC transporter permease [Granulosicoccus antarcticus]ASJ70386.1 Lactose transport system permease protein LacF [Granulosicoccus antarcticus IMCC3135]